MFHSTSAERRVLRLCRGIVARHLSEFVPVYRVGDIFTAPGLSDMAQELMQVALLAWLKAAANDPDMPNKLLRPEITKAVREAHYTDQILFTPIDARRKRLQRWRESPDYDENTENPARDILFEPLTDTARLTFALEPNDLSLIEKYWQLYGVCRDETERRFLEASFDSGLVEALEGTPVEEIPLPPNLEDLAEECGISLEAAYETEHYLHGACAAVLGVPVPKGRRAGGRPRHNRKQKQKLAG